MNNLQSTTHGLDCYTGTGKGNYWQMEFTNPYGIQSGISTPTHQAGMFTYTAGYYRCTE